MMEIALGVLGTCVLAILVLIFTGPLARKRLFEDER